MKRLLRRLSAAKSGELKSTEKVKADLVPRSELITPEEPAAGENCVDLTHYKLSDLVTFDGAIFPNSVCKYDDLFTTNSGHFIVRSPLTDSSGKRRGWNEVQVYVISRSGRVVLAEKNGILTHPKIKMAELLEEGKEHERMANQMEVTSKALDMAFRKDRRADARWHHQVHRLQTLELELAQTLKNILRMNNTIAVMKKSIQNSNEKLLAMQEHVVSKMEGEACSADPDNFKKYKDIVTPQDSLAFINDLNKNIGKLTLIRDLVQRKYALQRRQEKSKEKGKGKSHVEKHGKIRTIATGTKSGAAPRRRGSGLVQTLLQISDERRSAERPPPPIPPLETPL